MQVAAAAALSLLLAAPSLTPGSGHPNPKGPSSVKGVQEASRRARGALWQKAKAVAESFLSADSRDDLDGLLAEALDDAGLLAKLAAFDDVAGSLVMEMGTQHLDREALVHLVGETNADRIVSPTPLDQALQGALDQLKAERLVGVRRSGLALFMLSPEESVQLPGRLMQLLLDHWKSKLVGATLVAVVLGDKAIPGWRADTLYEALVRGKRATLLLLASIGVAVPDAFAPTQERVDLEAAIRRDQRLQHRLANALSFTPDDPDASIIFPPAVA